MGKILQITNNGGADSTCDDLKRGWNKIPQKNIRNLVNIKHRQYLTVDKCHTFKWNHAKFLFRGVFSQYSKSL